MVFCICVKFHEKKKYVAVFKLQGIHEYMTDVTIYNVQRVITPKVRKAELWYLCSAHDALYVFL